ncbi:MAG: metallophosphoesterase [Paenibacillus sp.]|nr:metallophosphoesterase [Paenibacillus sp.]
MYIEHLENDNVYETIIMVEGLETTITLLHVTDSHMSDLNEKDKRFIESKENFQKFYEDRNWTTTIKTRENFQNSLTLSKKMNADCVVFTGDIIHFPSSENIEATQNDLKLIGLPYLYTLGNHDWHYSHLEQWNDETRAVNYSKFFELTNGNPAYQMLEVSGIRLIAIDNSNYQISEQQLLFFKEQLVTEKPCLLFMHIPIYIPSLEADVVQRWKAPIMMAAKGWKRDTMEKWSVRAVDESTREFCELLTEGKADNLIAIFCGHVHMPHKDEFRKGRFQYVTKPGYEEGYRIIKLKPY